MTERKNQQTPRDEPNNSSLKPVTMDTKQALHECKKWLAQVAGAGEQTFGRPSYDRIFASHCTDRTEQLARDGDIPALLKEVGVKMPESFNVYWLEGGRVDEFDLAATRQAVLDKFSYTGFRELILFDETKSWLIFLDHDDNCKFRIIEPA